MTISIGGKIALRKVLVVLVPLVVLLAALTLILFFPVHAVEEEGYSMEGCTYDLKTCKLVGYQCKIGGTGCSADNCPTPTCN